MVRSRVRTSGSGTRRLDRRAELPEPWTAEVPKPPWDRLQRALELFRAGVTQHQDDPVFVREKLATVRGRRFAEVFGPDARKSLEEPMKRWLLRDFEDRAPG